jgi:DNA-directed RNA polymerase specialized sigma24 family protein
MKPQMENENRQPDNAVRTAAQFTTTHWSVVLAAGQGESSQTAEAMEKLCRTYWYPLYAYVRCEGYSPEDALDSTQAFFARLLEKHYLGQVGPQKGKIRSFLLAALRHFLSNQRDRARTVKRGGDAVHISLDAQDAEERYRLEPVDRMDAQRILERRWAMTLLERALSRLREESVSAGKTDTFECLQDFIAGESDVSCTAVAARMGLTESAVKSILHRLRQRYRALVREEIAQTVADPGEIDAEIRYLITVISQ